MKISNSEVSTFLMCERRHYYAHGIKLAPKNYGLSLSRGIIGHEALQAFYQGLIDEMPIEYARAKAIQAVHPYFLGNDLNLDRVQMLTGLVALLNQYFDDVAAKDDFVPIAAEQTLSMPLDENIEYPMRFDLLAGMKSGQYAGEVVLIDHKFVYNFWSVDDLMLNAQAPKYVATLRHNEVPVKRMIINQLRWREVKSNPERFRREVITPVAQEIRTVIREQYEASKRIAERMQDIEEYGKTAIRTLNHMTCTNCSFAMLCRVELLGQDPSLLIATDFKPNEYGYEDEEA